MKIFFIGLILLCFFSNSTFAQKDTVTVEALLNKNLSIEELMNIDVITAIGTPQKLTNAPSIIHVILASDLEKYAVTSLIDALKYIPGIETNLAPDGVFYISIRGLRKDGVVLLLIDGQPFNDFYNGRPILDLQVDFIEKIEVIEGPASAVYGTNAIAGVINVITKKTTKDISLRAGTNETYSAHSNYTFNKENLTFSINAGYFKTDGANQVIDSDKGETFDWSLTSGDKKNKTNRYVNDITFGTRVNYKNLKVNFFGIDRERGQYVGPTYILTTGSKYKNQQLLLDIRNDFKLNNNLTITPVIYTGHTKIENLAQESPENYISSISKNIFADGKLVNEEYSGIKTGGQIILNLQINENLNFNSGNIYERLTLYDYELTRNYKIVGDTYLGEFGNYDNVKYEQKDKSREVIAYYVNGNYRINKFGINAGFRMDSYSDFGNTFNPRIGVTYNLSKYLNIKGLYGTAFRAPTFRELYDNTTIGNEIGVKGNPDLKPESIKTYELQLESNVRNLLMRTSGFYFINNDAINIYDPIGSGSIGIYQNTGTITGFGYSVETILRINRRFNFFANFNQSFREFEWDTLTARKADLIYFSKKSYCQRLLKNIPTIRITSGLSITLHKFDFFTGFNYGYQSENNHRFYLEDARKAEIPEYFQLNYNLSYNYSTKLKIFISGNNIGNKYSDPDDSTNINAFGKKGLIQPGQTHLAGIKINF